MIKIGCGPLNLLIVDDDDVAAEGVVRSLRKHQTVGSCVVAADGREAIEILHGFHPDKCVQRPVMVLLDLNMPGMDGFEFLETIRADSTLKQIVVFVVTTSVRNADCTEAYRHNIAGYVVKSSNEPHYNQLADLLQAYSRSVSLPAA